VISKDIRDSGNPEYLMDAMNKIDKNRESLGAALPLFVHIVHIVHTVHTVHRVSVPVVA
jgi:hypothetical protein